MLKTLLSTFLLLAMLGGVSRVAMAECEGTQTEMNYCADREYREADRRLNELYKRLTKTPELIRSEKAWIAYRDAQCDWDAAEFEGGSMQPMAYSYCLTAMTEDRIKVLQDALSNANN